MSNYEVKIKIDRCKGCELCVFYCPAKHLNISSKLNKKGIKPARIKDGTKCIGCGYCFLICPDSCIEIHSEANSKAAEETFVKSERY